MKTVAETGIPCTRNHAVFNIVGCWKGNIFVRTVVISKGCDRNPFSSFFELTLLSTFEGDCLVGTPKKSLP